MNLPRFVSVDVGAPSLSGRTSFSAGTLAITAGGADIWESRDEFHFAHAPVVGDFEFTVTLDSLSMADVYTKAGLMVRTSLEADAAHVFFFAFGDNQPRNNNNGGIEFQFRAEDGGTCQASYPPLPLPTEPEFPVNFPDVWLKLSREGDTFTSQFSQDGVQWKNYGVHRQVLPASILVGLAVTSHHVEKTVDAVFSQVAFKTG